MRTRTAQPLTCPNCKRILEKRHLVKHHLVPRQKGGTHLEEDTVILCRPCEKQLHNLYPNSALKRDFNTREKIVGDPEMKKFGAWIGKKTPVTMRHGTRGGFHR